MRGTLRGGFRNERFDVSSSPVVRVVHDAQKTPPHFRQCYGGEEFSRGNNNDPRPTHVFPLEQGESDTAVQVVTLGGLRVRLRWQVIADCRHVMGYV